MFLRVGYGLFLVPYLLNPSAPKDHPLDTDGCGHQHCSRLRGLGPLGWKWIWRTHGGCKPEIDGLCFIYMGYIWGFSWNRATPKSSMLVGFSLQKENIHILAPRDWKPPFGKNSRILNHNTLITGWWFGTCFIFPYIGNNHHSWLSYFSDELKPPTRLWFI